MSTSTGQVPELSGSNASKVLWERAYQDLRDKDKEVLAKYEKQLAEANKILIEKELRERAINQWTVQIAGKSIKLRELGLNIISFINSSQAYVQSATSLEPHAALAWSCVSLLLPTILNQKGQHDAMLAGLDRVSHLIDFYMEWEKVYLDHQKVDFRETVVKLYGSILAYQARLLESLQKNSAIQFGRNMVKVDKWDDWLGDVNKWDECCKRFTTLADVEKEDGRWEKQYNVSEQILAALDDIRQQKLQKLSEGQESKRVELLRSLSSDYKRQKDSNPPRVPGTCEWFIKDQRFCQWRDSKESRLLHCYGDPGTGKSVLAKYLIDERLVANSDTVSVLYFFFKDGQEAQQHCANAMAAMLHQLYKDRSQRGMVVHAIPNFEAHGTNLSTMFDELWEVFEMTLNDPAAGEIVCVIDALDECIKQDRERLMQKITQYFSDPDAMALAGGRLKVLITSRPYGEIDGHYWPLSDNSAVVRLDGSDKASLIMEEINLVIKVKVPELLPRVSNSVRQTIIKHLQDTENRTYLWLHLMLDYIKKNIAGHGTEKGIKKIIQRLPPNIQTAYQSMLSKCTDPEQAKSLLCLVVAARRPLSVSEIQVALRLTLEDYESFEDIKDDMETDEQFKDSLKDLCGLLLSVHDDRVYLIHQTAREFVTQTNFNLGNGDDQWQGSISSMVAESIISGACISFLCLRNFQAQPPWGSSRMYPWEVKERHGRWIDKHTFLLYAAEYWSEHFKEIQDSLDIDLLKDAVNICRVGSAHFWVWCPLLCARLMQKVSGQETDMIVPSWLGLFTIVNAFIDEGIDSDTPRSDFGIALQAAAYGGQESVTQLLLEHGVDVNAQGIYDGNALYAACVRGHESVVKSLLEKGANVNAQVRRKGNALLAASSKGYVSVVQLLLEKGANVNAEDESHDNPLQAASNGGHESVVQLLLEKGANVNAQGGFYGNALYTASHRGDESIVQLLLEKGADINAQGGYYGNALQAACFGTGISVVKLLLEKGANINAQGGLFGNALQAASCEGHESVVELLLEKGATVNAQGGLYSSAIQAASYRGRESVVQLLLEKYANPNGQGKVYGNVLYVASSEGHESVVKLLLDSGADVNAQDGKHGNALLAASSKGHESVVELLLERGADINAQGGYYGHALQAASLGGHESVVQLLLENGAYINAQGGEYGNALQAASNGGHESVVQLLLENGANINAQGWIYGNALQAASYGGHESVVQLLLEKGADIHAQCGKYDSALRAASIANNESVVRLLLNKGADINSQAKFCGDELHVAISQGLESVVTLLLKQALRHESDWSEDESEY